MGFKYTTLATDAFTRANNADLGSDWTVGSDSLEIFSNQIRPSVVDSFRSETWGGRAWSENHWAEVTVVDATLIQAGSFTGAGVVVNSVGTGDYFFGIINATTMRIMFADLGFGSAGTVATKSFTPQAGDRVRLETRRVGSTVELTMWLRRSGTLTLELGPVYADSILDGVAPIPVSNLGGAPGVYCNVAASDALSDGLMDDFEAGEIEYVHGGFGGGIVPSWGEEPWGAEPVEAAGGNVTMPADAGSYAITGGAANFHISIPVAPGAYALTGSDVTPKVSMPAASGSYSITGGAATLEAIRHIIIEAGSYSITGSDVTPKVSMPAASGTYNITGTNASLLAARKLALDAGSYTLSGTDAALAKGRTLDAESGSYAITGQDAGLLASRLLIIGGGSYTLSGNDAGLLKGRTLAIDAGSYTIQGVEASLEAGREVVAGAGSYSITGGAVNFKVLLPAVSGSYVLTGQDVTFILFAPARIQAESGFYAIVGTDANLTSSAARRRTGAASQASLAALAWQAEFQDEEDVISYL